MTYPIQIVGPFSRLTGPLKGSTEWSFRPVAGFSYYWEMK